jgi:AcrR family transcriptional regulator
MESSHRSQKKLQTKMAILHAAFRLFAKKSYAAVSIAEIMATAQLAPRTFFLYFESKDALIAEAVRMIAADLQNSIEASSKQFSLESYFSWLTNLRFQHEAIVPDPSNMDVELLMRLRYWLGLELTPTILGMLERVYKSGTAQKEIASQYLVLQVTAEKVAKNNSAQIRLLTQILNLDLAS